MRKLGPVVTSAHLADSSLPELSEIEFAMTIASNGFERWMVRAMAAAGWPDMSPLEVQTLHLLHHRDRPKTLAEICLILNIEDTHTVNYALRKLTRLGLVEVGRRGKEKSVAASAEGIKACKAYRKVREELLLSAMTDMGVEPEQISRLASLMRALSGHYDQATRAAAAF
ncbi:MAG: winged helix DNA-binding protein [Pseudomonadota bacterium]